MKYEENDPSAPKGESRPELPEKADELLQAARKRGRGLLDRQKNAAVQELSSVSDVMKEAARKFDEKEEGGVGGYVRKAAEQLDRFSSTLKDRDLGELVKQAESGLREKPALFLGVTAALGFIIGRFLRAGSQKIARDIRERTPEGGNGST